MISDLADDAPVECAWCGDPATEVVTMGHAQTRPGAPWRPRYEWMCPPCATDAERERNWSRAQ